MSKQRWVSVLVTAVLGAGVGGVTAWASSSGSGQSDTTPTVATEAPAAAAPDGLRPTVSAIPAALTNRFAALRRGRRQGDGLPSASRVDGKHGENPALSRRVAQIGGQDEYLVPGNGVLCLYDARGGGTCADNDTASRGELVEADMCARDAPHGTVRLLGVLPDGVSTATIVRADGSKQAVNLGGNGLAVDAPVTPLPVSLTWTGPDGNQHSEKLPVPADAANNPCG